MSGGIPLSPTPSHQPAVGPTVVCPPCCSQEAQEARCMHTPTLRKTHAMHGQGALKWRHSFKQHFAACPGCPCHPMTDTSCSQHSADAGGLAKDGLLQARTALLCGLTRLTVQVGVGVCKPHASAVNTAILTCVIQAMSTQLMALQGQPCIVPMLPCCSHNALQQTGLGQVWPIVSCTAQNTLMQHPERVTALMPKPKKTAKQEAIEWVQPI